MKKQELFGYQDKLCSPCFVFPFTLITYLLSCYSLQASLESIRDSLAEELVKMTEQVIFFVHSQPDYLPLPFL